MTLSSACKYMLRCCLFDLLLVGGKPSTECDFCFQSDELDGQDFYSDRKQSFYPINRLPSAFSTPIFICVFS